MSDLEKTALNLAAHGFAVFPLVPGQKTPLIKDWPNQATQDKDKIHEWWSQTPSANIGIVCGEKSAHLVVIDIDNKHGHSGDSSMHEWVNEHGSLPPTLTVVTPNNGMHLYYRDLGHWNSPQNVLDGVDIRCNGSYIVGPGSVLETGEYKVMTETPDRPSMINDSVKALLKLQGYAAKQGTGGKPFEDDGQPVAEGGRHGWLMSMAGKAIKAHPEWTEDQIVDYVRQLNDTRCVPPLGGTELERTILNGVRKLKSKRDAGPPDDHLASTTFTEAELKELQADQEQKERQEAIQQIEEELPAPVSFATVWNDMPPLAPVLIDGVLRVGHKMIISGPSKAGKSFLLIELAFAMAEGMNWLGCRCRQGKVLYLNMEIDQASFFRRIQNVYKAHGMNQNIHPENIVVWNLRGHSKPITELAPAIIDQCKKDKGYEAIIVDPLYKVIQGDENSNSDIGTMARGFDQIANETGCSIIYAHHFAKGNGGDKDAIDRGSGAGVFARDPDAITTMTQIDYENEVDSNITAWRIEFVLREFANKDPVDVFFEYPLHKIDNKSTLKDLGLVTTFSKQKKAKEKAMKEQNDIRSENMRQCAERCRKVDDDGGFTTSDFMNEYSKFEQKGRRTIEGWLENLGYEKSNPSGNSKSGQPGIWHKSG